MWNLILFHQVTDDLVLAQLRRREKSETMAKILVFENHQERAWKAAMPYHDWENQPCIFGRQEERVLKICEELYRNKLHFGSKELEKKLLRKLYGIAKFHGVRLTWYGNSSSAEPDRFMVSGRGEERLALIYC